MTTIYQFEKQLLEEEKSAATIEKYVRDVKQFYQYLMEQNICPIEAEITKELLVRYKKFLCERYELSSVNSMIAAMNRYLEFIGKSECKLKSIRIQHQLCRSKEKELSKDEYLRLMEAAKNKKQLWLYYIMMTICSTGIRVSELQFITVESLSTRRTMVTLKGKSRIVILPKELCIELRQYVRKNQIKRGTIFVTRNGKNIDRNNILHAMKRLCKDAGVEKSKVFPHNLRHLFAVTFYKLEKDLGQLADLLGHTNINTTRIYTRISSEEQEKRMGHLGFII